MVQWSLLGNVDSASSYRVSDYGAGCYLALFGVMPNAAASSLDGVVESGERVVIDEVRFMFEPVSATAHASAYVLTRPAATCVTAGFFDSFDCLRSARFGAMPTSAGGCASFGGRDIAYRGVGLALREGAVLRLGFDYALCGNTAVCVSVRYRV